jgi:predicted DNA binding CopG/RHH family protein
MRTTSKKTKRELNTPKLANEKEEARWWAAHQRDIAKAFEAAAREGRVRRGSSARTGATPTTTIRLEPEDLSLARVQAQRRGLRYQTYLKMLLREALQAEERKAG